MSGTEAKRDLVVIFRLAEEDLLKKNDLEINVCEREKGRLEGETRNRCSSER